MLLETKKVARNTRSCQKLWPSNWKAPVMLEFNISKVGYCSGKSLGEDVPGGTLDNFGWGRAAGTLQPLACIRAGSAVFCYPILA